MSESKPKRKITKAEKLQRVAIVSAMILRGFSRREIIQNTSMLEPVWNVSDRTVDSYIHSAYETMKVEADKFTGHQYGKAIARMNKLYERLYAKEDYSGCINVQRELNKMMSLYLGNEASTNKGSIQEWLEMQKK